MSGTDHAEGPRSVTGFFKGVVREFAAFGPDAEPFAVELLASEILGECWEAAAEDGGEDLVPELIAFAARKTSPGAAALLAALRELAPAESDRIAAADALAAAVRRGLPEPEWADLINKADPAACVRTGDIYGDSCSVLCVFGEGEEAHGVLALVELSRLGGWASDVIVVEGANAVAEEMRAEVEQTDLAYTEPLTGGRARQLIEDGIAATDRIPDAVLGEDYARFRALALARCRALPDPEPVLLPAELSEVDREELVTEFVRATGVPREPARRLIDEAAAYDPYRPLRAGPEKLIDLLDPHLDTEDAQAMVDVVLAFAEWAGERDGLPEEAITAMTAEIADYLEDDDEAEEDGEYFDAYLDGSEQVRGPDELTDLLERRIFAVPSRHVELGDEEVELDPADQDDRRLLVVGDHPEYHQGLADDTLDETARLRLALETAVVDQLWDGDPAEVWQAARRLRDGGMDRDEVLDALVGALAEQVAARENDDDRVEFDPAGYRAALAELG